MRTAGLLQRLAPRCCSRAAAGLLLAPAPAPPLSAPAPAAAAAWPGRFPARYSSLAARASSLDDQPAAPASTQQAAGAPAAAAEPWAAAAEPWAAGAAPAGQPLAPALYVVGTPIGNLEDISLRALRVLRGASLVLAEDTRHSRKLLMHFGITTPTTSFHAHNERLRERAVLQRLQGGEAIALISDAGMPGISDPGSALVAAAVEAGVRVVPVPGPCAVVAALAASGLPTDSFLFVGFLPPKSGKRRAALQQLQRAPATLVFYVPPHGLAAVLVDVQAVLGGGRRCVVARELTKLHEEFFRGSVSDALEEFGPGGRRGGVVKGELVLLVDGCELDDAGARVAAAAAAAAATAAAIDTAPDADGHERAVAGGSGSGTTEDGLRQLLRVELLGGSSVSASSKALAKQFGLPRGRIYKIALEVEQALQASGGTPQQQQQQQQQC